MPFPIFTHTQREWHTSKSQQFDICVLSERKRITTMVVSHLCWKSNIHLWRMRYSTWRSWAKIENWNFYEDRLLLLIAGKEDLEMWRTHIPEAHCCFWRLRLRKGNISALKPSFNFILSLQTSVLRKDISEVLVGCKIMHWRRKFGAIKCRLPPSFKCYSWAIQII